MDIEERFTQPHGWQWGQINPREGQFLRYGMVSPANPRALAFVFPGLSEYIEKYFEVTRDLMTRGFAVVVVDWRGHGKSWRYPIQGGARHHDSFTNDVQDAFTLIDAVSAHPALTNLPKMIVAHSMGAHIGLRVLHDRPDVFKCAVMNAPLQGIRMGIDGTLFQWLLAKFLNAVVSTRTVNGPWSEERFLAQLDILTTDEKRRALKLQQVHDYPDLRSGSITFGWVHAAVDSMRLTNRASYLNAIKTPILMTIAGKEMVVSNKAIRKAARFLPNVQIVDIPGALHEVMMEQDTYRSQFWHAFDAFVAKYL